MIDVIVQFSRILYEPLSVTVLLAVALAVYLNRRKRDRLFWVIGGSIFFMVAWRLGIGIGSSRYASMLIYPTILLAAYFCYRVTELFPNIPWLREIPARYYSWISRALLAGLLLACVIKDLRFNRYADYMPAACKVVRADAVHYRFPVILTFPDEAKRMRYYSGLECLAINTDDIRRAVKPYRFQYDVIYVAVNEGPGGNLAGDGSGKWELISSQFKNNRKRAKFNIYRYTPAHDGIWRRAIPPGAGKSPEFPVANGDFEKGSRVLSDDLYIRRFRNKEIPFFRKAGFLFPADWSLVGAPGFDRDCAGEVELSGNAIAGAYSLRMSAAGRISVAHEEIHPASSAQLEWLVKGTPGSVFAVAIDAYNADGDFLGFKIVRTFRIFSDDVYRCNIPVIPEDASPFDKFRLYFLLENGEIYLDNLSLRFEK